MNLAGLKTSKGTVARHKGGRVRLYDPYTSALTAWKPVAEFPELEAVRDDQTRQDGTTERQGSFFTAGEAVSEFVDSLSDKIANNPAGPDEYMKAAKDRNTERQKSDMDTFWDQADEFGLDRADLNNDSRKQREGAYGKLLKSQLQTLASILGLHYNTKTTKTDLAWIIDQFVQTGHRHD